MNRLLLKVAAVAAIALMVPTGIAAADELIGRKTMLGTIEPIPAPPPQVRTYVETHTVEPVYIEDEVVVGTTLPETVEVREIPDYRYQYVYVNEQPVLVEPESRRIVYVLR